MSLPSLASASKPYYRTICVVWGHDYIERYLNISLPSQLSPNNLPFAASHGPITYVIYTAAADEPQFRKSRWFEKLNKLANVEFVLIENISADYLTRLDRDHSGRYEVMNECYCHFLKASENSLASLIFMSPDAIYSDGTIKFAVEAEQSGKRIVVGSAYRVNIETFVPSFMEEYGEKQDIQIESKKVVRYILDHMHPATSSWFRNTELRSQYPGAMLWRVGDEGFLSHFFFLFTILIRPSDFSVLPTYTPDGDYMNNVSTDDSDFAIADNSDKAAILEFSYNTQGENLIYGAPYEYEVLAEWMEKNLRPRHRRLFANTPIRMHCKDCSSLWDAAEAQAREFFGALDLADRLRSKHRAALAGATTDQVNEISAAYFLAFRELLSGEYIKALGVVAFLIEKKIDIEYLFSLIELIISRMTETQKLNSESLVTLNTVLSFLPLTPEHLERLNLLTQE